MKIERALSRASLHFVLVLCCSLCFFSCGKVAEPQAPFIRIPEAVKDLTAAQSGYNILLTWTNPAHNIDGSTAVDLANIRIQQGGVPLVTLKAGEAGKPQSHSIPLVPGSNATRTFDLIIDTDRAKVSNVSNTVSITPVDVPGAVPNLAATVDQYKIVLTWNKPQERPELADAYVITRTDLPAQSETVPETKYEDTRYQERKMVTYQITPVRHIGDRTVAGVGTATKTVTIVDTTPPQPPSGLELNESDTGVFLTWDPNSETDLAGYHVFRTDGPNEGFKPLIKGLITRNSFNDPSYKTGAHYTVSAVDVFNNESKPSPAVP